MSVRRRSASLVGAFLGMLLCSAPTAGPQEAAVAPRVLLDQPLRAVEYQLNALSNDQLVLIERRPGDARYRPVYHALLMRSGLGREIREEALAALAAIDRTSRTRVLLGALGRVPADDALAAERVIALLVGQTAETLRRDRPALAETIAGPAPPIVLRGAYGGLIMADGAVDEAWRTAAPRFGHLVALLRSVPHLPSGALRAQLFTPVATLLRESDDPSLRAEALGVIGWTRPDAAAFDLLAGEILAPGANSNEITRAAAVQSLLQIPAAAWPQARIEPLAHAMVAFLGVVASSARTDPAAVEAIQLGEKLATALPEARARTIHRELRALGVQVVRIQTLKEQMRFDLNWAVVEAGKAVQVVFTNTDVMPHNLVIGEPGSLSQIGTAGGALPMSIDPDAKPFVPDMPVVLHATKLVTEGETVRLDFTAPDTPGAYVFLCTYPGHWVRMYGVLLVVDALEGWEVRPTPPVDPLTNQPFASARNIATAN